MRFEAASGLTGVYEQQGDLLAACRLHERLIAEGEPERAALPLAFNRIRLDDVAGARAAFELGAGELCRFGRLVLDEDFEAAARAMPEGEERAMAGLLAMECANAWQRTGRTGAADGALSLVAAAGHAGQRQQAGCLLGALRGDAGTGAGRSRRSWGRWATTSTSTAWRCARPARSCASSASTPRRWRCWPGCPTPTAS
ncbi:hypothetical protein ACFQ0B_70605 [Nonomuraea thailandensis]